jgi:hypothetical protein
LLIRRRSISWCPLDPQRRIDHEQRYRASPVKRCCTGVVNRKLTIFDFSLQSVIVREVFIALAAALVRRWPVRGNFSREPVAVVDQR